jgi:hypothetical protein
MNCNDTLNAFFKATETDDDAHVCFWIGPDGICHEGEQLKRELWKKEW